MSSQLRRIGIIGSGPMGGYALRHLLASEIPLSVTVFEAEDVAGCGMPYRAGMNADEMYCNAFSREIPVFSMHLSTWLKDQSDEFLQEWNLTKEDIDARSFYPRVLLGKYLADEFETLCAKARAEGHEVSVLTRHRVADIQPKESHVICICDTESGPVSAAFDDVIIATGHTWPEQPQIDGVSLISPWPFTNITDLPPTKVGILGASLSAIDVVVALALQHGAFTDTSGQVSWYPHKGSEGLHITMVSHNGIMPEPDFYYHFPYEPLRHITHEAVSKEIEAGSDGLLQRIFALLIRELQDADPDYLPSLGPDAETIKGFSAGYAQHRKDLGGLRALEASLGIAMDSFESKTTLPHRYAMLRGHENFEIALEHLDSVDTEAFRTYLAPVFADCYAAIPHISVQRVLALYNAGVIDLLPTIEGAEFSQSPEGVRVETIDGPIIVEAMIDARGQTSASLADLPFPSLVSLLDEDNTDLTSPYKLAFSSGKNAGVYCLAMPQILARNPFAQGLANCEALSGLAVADLLSA